MSLLQEIARELLGMFLADARLTGAILVLVLLVTGLILGLGVDALIGGSLLLIGSLALLVDAAFRETRARRNRD